MTNEDIQAIEKNYYIVIHITPANFTGVYEFINNYKEILLTDRGTSALQIVLEPENPELISYRFELGYNTYLTLQTELEVLEADISYDAEIYNSKYKIKYPPFLF